jgi:prepilin signal peptidase PulO-like enzyme (type II secretory pathway)
MNTIAFVFIFLLGTIIGSFLNVVIYRFNTGKPIGNSRSICMSCSHTLSWYELIPLFSFLIQKGRCRSCASTISHQYPIVEFGTGLIFALLAFHFMPFLSYSQTSYVLLVGLFSFIFSLLMVITVYDMRHKIIPDTLVYAYSLVAFLSIWVNHTDIGPLLAEPSISSMLAGPLLALPFALLWLVSGGKWMGLGDAKLMLGIGWMLGLLSGIAALILSFWIGALFSLGFIIFAKRKVTMKTQIPFAPFLILASLIVLLFSIDVFSISSLFNVM